MKRLFIYKTELIIEGEARPLGEAVPVESLENLFLGIFDLS